MEQCYTKIVFALYIVAMAIVFNGLCQRYEPTNSGQNGLCARFDRLTGEHEQRSLERKWEKVLMISDGVPVR